MRPMPPSKQGQELHTEDAADSEEETEASEWAEGGGPGQNRTGDTRIFSAMLYQLSYRATKERS